MKRTDLSGTGAWRPPCRGEKESCDGTGVEVGKETGWRCVTRGVGIPRMSGALRSCETALRYSSLSQLLGLSVGKRGSLGCCAISRFQEAVKTKFLKNTERIFVTKHLPLLSPLHTEERHY